MESPSKDCWVSILDPPLFTRARRAIEEIDEAVTDSLALGSVAGVSSAPSSPQSNPGLSMGEGLAGLAVFFTYLHLAEPGRGHDEKARRLLRESAQGLGTSPMSPSLYGGFPGVAWAVAHLGDRLFDSVPADVFGSVDETLLGYLGQSPWRAAYDLIGGLVGIGVYALERSSDPKAAACLGRVIGRLAEAADHTPEGITWKTAPELLPPLQRRAAPQGHYNLGVAHGVPGVIALLGRACAADISTEVCQRLLDGAVRWLLGRQLPDGMRTRFSSWHAVGEAEHRPSRMAWCYGDPGIAAALLCAAQGLRESGGTEPAWRQAALELALRAAECPLGDSGVVDTPLCHGSAGLAHIYNRLYQSTREEKLLRASRMWFEHTLDERRPGLGMAGFASRERGGWVAHPGFLTGAAGVGLALLGATTTVEPLWDRVLLASVAPSPRWH